MHIKLPEKAEESLRYLRLKFLPKTLFFRTMLLIFIPLIVVQVVSVVMFFDGSWSRMGRRLSDNLTSDMSFIMEQVNRNPSRLKEMQALSSQKFGMEFEYYSNQDKLKAISKVRKANRMIVGYLEESLEKAFPKAEINIFEGKADKDLVVMIDSDQGLYRFLTTRKKDFQLINLYVCCLDGGNFYSVVFGGRSVFAHTGSFDCRVGASCGRFRQRHRQQRFQTLRFFRGSEGGAGIYQNERAHSASD